MGDPVRVLIADDHPIFREGTARIVAEHPGLELIAACADGEEALRRIRELEPDVALVDLRMPKLDGEALVTALSEGGSRTRVVLLSMWAESAVVHEALAKGAAGYLSKEADRQHVGEAVLAAARGEIVLSPQVQLALIGEIRRQRAQEHSPLTDREIEVLQLMAEGLSAGKIARRLFLSVATVKSHQHHIYGKLNVGTGAAAVYEATRRALL